MHKKQLFYNEKNHLKIQLIKWCLQVHIYELCKYTFINVDSSLNTCVLELGKSFPLPHKATLSTFSYTPAPAAVSPAAVSVLCVCLSFDLILISYSGLFSML